MSALTLNDRQEIADLMTGWMYRDVGDWKRLLGLFHNDGTIEITWFNGRFADFVDASARMGQSDLRTKHLVSSPVVVFNGDRALAETNAIITIQNGRLGYGAIAHNRFYDRLEKRGDAWKLLHRQSIYDMSSFAFPFGPIEIDAASARRFPIEYAALAYVLDASGFPVNNLFATQGSDLEAKMKRDGQAWLND